MTRIFFSQVVNLFWGNIYYVFLLILIKQNLILDEFVSFSILIPIVIYINTLTNFGSNQTILAQSRAENFDLTKDYQLYLFRSISLLIISCLPISYYLSSKNIPVDAGVLIVLSSVLLTIIAPYWLMVLTHSTSFELLKIILASAVIGGVFVLRENFYLSTFLIFQFSSLLVASAFVYFYYHKLFRKANFSFKDGVFSFKKFLRLGVSIQLSVLVSGVFPIFAYGYIDFNEVSNFFFLEKIRYLILAIASPFLMTVASRMQLKVEVSSRSQWSLIVVYLFYSIVSLLFLYLIRFDLMNLIGASLERYLQMLFALFLSLITAYVGNVLFLGASRSQHYFASLAFSTFVFLIGAILIFMLKNPQYIYIPVYMFEVSLLCSFIFCIKSE